MRALLCLVALATLCGTSPGQQRRHRWTRPETRLVFAHYMLANRDDAPDDGSPEADIAAYEREIRQAQSIGVDGFALNAGGWFTEPRYIRRAAAMFEAARRLHSGFRLFFSADMCCSNTAADVEDMMRRFAGNPLYAPVYFRFRGRFLLSTFAGEARGPAFWRALREDLEQGRNPSLRPAPCEQAHCPLAALQGVPRSAPLPIALVPAFFFGGETPGPQAVRTGLENFGPLLDGAFYWGIAGVPGSDDGPNQIPSSQAYAAALHGSGKAYMAPVALQFWGANAGRYYEYSGFAGMTALWRNAIEVTHPEWVEIITWNDFVEGTYISPIADPAFDRAPGVSTPVHSHAAATELSRYFIQWYKTGQKPAIHVDSIYWAYHPALVQGSLSANVHAYGPVADVVYITAHLRAPAVLRVSFGAHTAELPLPAGASDVQTPALPGLAPHFELRRGEAVVMRGQGKDVLRPAIDSQHPDLYYSTGFVCGAGPGQQHAERGRPDPGDIR